MHADNMRAHYDIFHAVAVASLSRRCSFISLDFVLPDVMRMRMLRCNHFIVTLIIREMMPDLAALTDKLSLSPLSLSLSLSLSPSAVPRKPVELP
jgi:hypothetical protein